MNQQEVLEQLNKFTVSEASTFSFLTGPTGERCAVVKTSSGSGATEPLQDTMDSLCTLSSSSQQDIYDAFNSTSQVMGGNPCK